VQYVPATRRRQTAATATKRANAQCSGAQGGQRGHGVHWIELRDCFVPITMGSGDGGGASGLDEKARSISWTRSLLLVQL
jgi:hypothetical protein